MFHGINIFPVLVVMKTSLSTRILLTWPGRSSYAVFKFFCGRVSCRSLNTGGLCSLLKEARLQVVGYTFHAFALCHLAVIVPIMISPLHLVAEFSNHCLARHCSPYGSQAF